MLKQEAEKIARPIIKAVVDCIADKRYKDLTSYAEFKDSNSLELFKDCTEGFLKISNLPHFDRYGVPYNFSPNSEYSQLNVYVYNNGTGFAVDYDFTTNGVINDLTLQMEFLFTESNKIKAYILDAHVL